MTPCPDIVAYSSTHAPKGYEWSARFFPLTRRLENGKYVDGNPKPLPIIIYAESEEMAVLLAQRFWADEQDKLAAKAKATLDRAAARLKGKAT